MNAKMQVAALSVLAAAALGGCIGSRSYVVANSLKYPVSMSSGMRGPDGRVLASHETEKVGTFRLDYTTCRMLWTIIPLKSGTRDISDDVNEQVPRKNGEAIVNFSAESSATAWNVATMLGILPDCSKVRLRGDIVARSSFLQPPVATAAAPAAMPVVPPPAAAVAAEPTPRPQGVAQ